MGDLIRFAKAWAVINLITRLVLVFGVVALVCVVLFGSGGELKIIWSFNP